MAQGGQAEGKVELQIRLTSTIYWQRPNNELWCLPRTSSRSKRPGSKFFPAPVDDVVQQLAVHTIGGVVDPGLKCCCYLLLDANLEISANALNRLISALSSLGTKRRDQVEIFTSPVTGCRMARPRHLRH